MMGKKAPAAGSETARLFPIFFARSAQRQKEALEHGTRFVHYTSAETATQILRNKELWMRNAVCMNDYREVEHGLECLYRAYGRAEHGGVLKQALDELAEGLSKDVEELFDAWSDTIRTGTFLTSISEHLDSEDAIGRLSMWRAYGGSVNVALVLKGAPLLRPPAALGTWCSPVDYFDTRGFGQQMVELAGSIAANRQQLAGERREAIGAMVFNALRVAAVCTKHPGFAEEREWRVVYCPELTPAQQLQQAVEVIEGVPQPIIKIPLQGAHGAAELSALVDRIIIGPAQFPVPLKDAFVTLLHEAAVPDPEQKVFVSDIPLRR